jgi:hypothetical protein
MGIFDILSSAPGEKAAADQIAAIQQGKQDLTKQFGSGRGALTTDYAAALSPYTSNFANAQQGQNMYGNALGLGGAAGNAAALQGFLNNPGYQFQLQQGEDAAMANAARLGQLNSGNTLVDLDKFGQGLANTSWGQYLANLQPYLGAANSAAGGIAGVNTGLGNQMNASYQGLGNALYGADTSIGKAQAGGDLAAYNASGNLWGTGLALAGDVASVLGGKPASIPKFG